MFQKREGMIKRGITKGYLSLCVLCQFIPFLSVFFVFHSRDLVLLNLIERCAISTSNQYLNIYIADPGKGNFCIRKLFSVWLLCVYNRWFQYMFTSACAYIGLCISCMCDIKSRYYQKQCHIFQSFSKFDILFHKTQQGITSTKESRLNKFRSLILKVHS